SVAYLFSKQGMLRFPAEIDEEAIIEAAISAGAEDVITNGDGTHDVITTPQSFEAVRDAMQASGFAPEVAEVTQHASTGVPLPTEDAEKTLRLLEMLEDLDDVQNVYTNADFPEELAKQQQG
ncbi:MAG: YebC/PmpR family DNA-binding transcriptional regulator, partial [Acidiferrobacterales bacterium]